MATPAVLPAGPRPPRRLSITRRAADGTADTFAASPRAQNEKEPPQRGGSIKINRRRPTLPVPFRTSTIGAEGLNCSVRNGKRCFPLAIATGNSREPPAVPQNCTDRHIGYHARTRGASNKYPSSPRSISTGLLQASPLFQIRPINLVVYQGTYPLEEVGEFILRSASRLDAFSGYPIRT